MSENEYSSEWSRGFSQAIEMVRESLENYPNSGCDIGVAEQVDRLTREAVERVLNTQESWMKHYYENVPGLGNIVVSRHAQDRMAEYGISQQMFENALMGEGSDIREAGGILWREKNGVRLVVIEKPEPFRGAKLIKTVVRVAPQRKAKS